MLNSGKKINILDLVLSEKKILNESQSWRGVFDTTLCDKVCQ
jgi:hypothetical protein